MGIEIGGLYVRRSSLINATPARAWQEFTSFEKFDAWFGIGHRLESYYPTIGGEVRLSIEDGHNRLFFGGKILVFDPGRELSFTENWEQNKLATDCTITIRLTALYNACHVELFHHGFERLGASAASDLEGHEQGWHTRHLETLKRIVEAN